MRCLPQQGDNPGQEKKMVRRCPL